MTMCSSTSLRRLSLMCGLVVCFCLFFFSSRRRHTRLQGDWSSDVCSSDLRKDKDFVFVSYEGWQEVIPFPGAGQNAIPLDMRDGQHFTKYGMSIFDPLTTRPCGSVPTEPCSGSTGSTYWRDPFPGNVIPQSR